MRKDNFIMLIRAAGALDGAGFERAGVTAIVRLSTADTPPDIDVIAVGSRDDVEAHPAALGRTPIELPHHALIPGLVNAHTHLDLTHLGPIPIDPDMGFVSWISMIMKARNELTTPVPETVRLGIEKSIHGGVVAIGDIAGTINAAQKLRDSLLHSVSFLEVFGLGNRIEPNWTRIAHELDELNAPGAGHMRVSVTPHAPYSAGREMYQRAAAWCMTHHVPMSTHFSETPAELEFVAQGTGEMCGFLTRLGLMDHIAMDEFGDGESPVEHVADAVRGAQVIAAHVNACHDRDIELLAELGVTVAYCPRASAYFEHDQMFGPHRYREMMSAGVNVALGTDSIVCHPAAHADRLSTLDEARLLYARDGSSVDTLMAMMTIHGARALGLDEKLFRFPTTGSGKLAGVNVVDIAGVDGTIGQRVMQAQGLAQPLGPV